MKRLLVPLAMLPTSLLAWGNIQVVESPSPQPRNQGWEDPVLILTLLGAAALALATWSFKAGPAPKTIISALVAGGCALIGAALFWPQFGGVSIPFEALGKVDVNAFNKIFLPTFIKAGIAGVAGYLAAWYLLPEDVPQERVNVQAQPAAQTRENHPLQTGDRIKTYKGYEIVKAENGVTVDGVAYSGLLAAEKVIDAMAKSPH